MFEEWVWNDAGIGNVYPKFKPPSGSKFFLLTSKKNILGSICGDVWKNA